MPKTQARVALVPSTSQAVSPAATRQRVDCTAVDGGILTFRMENSGSPPTEQCVASVMVAHKGSAMPAVGAEGTGDLDWKRVYAIGGSTVASEITRGVYRFGPEVAYLQVEFTGNAGNTVTVEAHVTTFVY